jgi:hypothetical protein
MASFDPTPVTTFFVRAQEPAGWWRALNPEVPWLQHRRPFRRRAIATLRDPLPELELGGEGHRHQHALCVSAPMIAVRLPLFGAPHASGG